MTPVYVTGVDFFITNSSNPVKAIEACKSDGTWVSLWKKPKKV